MDGVLPASLDTLPVYGNGRVNDVSSPAKLGILRDGVLFIQLKGPRAKRQTEHITFNNAACSHAYWIMV